MFLRPQHFQHAARHQRALMSEEISVARPYSWGVQEIEVAEAELESDLFTIRRLNVRLKDGTRIVVPENAEIEPRDIKSALDESNGSLDVYLALPLLMDREPNTLMLYEEKSVHDRRFKGTLIERVDDNKA